MTPWVGSAATPGGVQRQRGTAAEGVQHQRGTVRQQVRQAAHGSLSQRFLRTLRLTVQVSRLQDSMHALLPVGW